MIERERMSAHVSQSATLQNVQNVAVASNEDDSEPSPEKHPFSQQNEIKPSKSKYDRFLEDVKTREINAEARIFSDIKVDPQCEVPDVKVFQDYSAKLTL